MGGNSMKVVSKIPMLLVLLVGLFLFGSPNSQATDVWVAQNSNGIDIYVMDDTIKYGTNKTGRWFSVSTKRVRNGQLIGVSTTQYSKYKTDMWRYYIKTQQAGRFEPVTPKSQVFEYVMKDLRWYYEVKSGYGRSSYYY